MHHNITEYLFHKLSCKNIKTKYIMKIMNPNIKKVITLSIGTQRGQ